MTLAACPFCGKEQGRHVLLGGRQAMGCFGIGCFSCGAVGPGAMSRDEAAAAWNRRATVKESLPVAVVQDGERTVRFGADGVAE